MDYQTVWKLQEETRLLVLENKDASRVFAVEHPPTITFGRAEKGENLIASKDWLEKEGFALIETNRGGKITYHGPGQLVVYPIVDLNALHIGIKDYVHGLESCMIEALGELGIRGRSQEGMIGAWVDDRKIGSIGIHVRKHVSIHGLALNVQTDLSHFALISPCGLQGIQMTSIKDLGVETTLQETADLMREAFEKVFKIRFLN